MVSMALKCFENSLLKAHVQSCGLHYNYSRLCSCSFTAQLAFPPRTKHLPVLVHKKTIFLCLRPKQMFSGYTVPCTLSKRFDGSQHTCICNNPCCYLQVHPLFDKAESKNKLLRSVAGGGVEQISQLQARWDKFEMMMESHELMIKEQVGKTQE